MSDDIPHQQPITVCGICKSTRLTNLGHKQGYGTIFCNSCDAHWWKKWFTRKEWDEWINGIKQ